MSPEKVAQLLSRFTYKPNWRFEVMPGPPVSIHLDQYVEDSREPYRPWDLKPEEPDFISLRSDLLRYEPWVVMSPRRRVFPVGGRVEVPPIAENREDRFWTWLHDVAIPDLERHEISEWFKVDGKLAFDPHEER